MEFHSFNSYILYLDARDLSSCFFGSKTILLLHLVTQLQTFLGLIFIFIHFSKKCLNFSFLTIFLQQFLFMTCPRPSSRSPCRARRPSPPFRPRHGQRRRLRRPCGQRCRGPVFGGKNTEVSPPKMDGL